MTEAFPSILREQPGPEAKLPGPAALLKHLLARPMQACRLVAALALWKLGKRDAALEAWHKLCAAEQDPLFRQRFARAYGGQVKARITDLILDASGTGDPSIKANGVVKAQLDRTDEIMAGWRVSPTAKRIAASNRQIMATGPAVPVPHRPHKLLILSDGNWNFLGPTIDAFSADPEVELRCAEVSRLRGSALIDTSRLFAPQNDVVADIADMNARLKQDAPEIHELIEWADTIFVEWCSVTAVWASRYLPLDKRLVIRMHGSEVFSVWPAFVNWGRVDALITVAPFMRDFATRKFGLEAFGHLDRPVFSNVTDIARFPADKTAAADHTLGMIGYNTANKNARIALDVLTELRRDSDIWQLKLIGGDFPDHEQAAKQAFEATLAADPDLRGNVIFTGFTKTPETEFPDVGYLLSLSDREGCHTAVMEGMASGAVPVILDWHLLRKWNAARALYGDQYVVDTPQQVAARIREIAEAGTRAQLGQKAQTEAFEKFDFNSVWPAFRQTILG